MDSVEFYLVYLSYLIILSGLITVFFVFRAKKPKILKIRYILRFLLISAFTIYILDSIPYSVADISEIPDFYMNLGVIFWFLLSYITILYELSKFEPKRVDKTKERK